MSKGARWGLRQAGRQTVHGEKWNRTKHEIGGERIDGEWSDKDRRGTRKYAHIQTHTRSRAHKQREGEGKEGKSRIPNARGTRYTQSFIYTTGER